MAEMIGTQTLATARTAIRGVLPSARFPPRVPGKLVQGMAQRFQAGKACVRFGVGATLERHRRSPVQRSTSWCFACSKSSLGSGVLLEPVADRTVPPIVEWPRKAAKGSTICHYQSSCVETQVFPWQIFSSRENPASPWSKGLAKIVSYQGTPSMTTHSSDPTCAPI